MECKHVIRRLNAFLDHELPKDIHYKMMRHLRYCPTCQKKAAIFRNLTDTLNLIPQSPTPYYLTRFAPKKIPLVNKIPGISDWWQELNFSMRSALFGVALAGLLCGIILGESASTFSVQPSDQNELQLFLSEGLLP